MVVAELGVRPTLKKFFLTSYFNAKYWFNEKWSRRGVQNSSERGALIYAV